MAFTFARAFDPLFPFPSSRHELRGLCEFSNMMENAFADSDAVEHRTPNYCCHRGLEGLSLEVELPGVAKEHIEIEMHRSILSVTGKRFKTENGISDVQNGGDEQKESKDETMAEKSTVTHVYKLRFKVGNNVDEENVKAEHNNGVLNMYVPYNGKSGVRRIAISEN